MADNTAAERETATQNDESNDKQKPKPASTSNDEKKKEKEEEVVVTDPTTTTSQQQRVLMKKVGVKVQELGDTWYPISKKWYDSWVSYTMFNKGDDDIPGGIEKLDERGVARPGKIDNSDLADPNEESALRKDIQEHRTHIWIHSDVWDLLVSWYNGGPAFPRTVYERGSSYNKEKYICIYPQMVKLVFCDDQTGDVDCTKYTVRGFPPDYTLKSMAKDLESELPKDDEKQDDKNKDDTPLVHIWLKYGQVKAIYPINKKVKVTEEDLANEDMERWVEVPDDYLKTKLDDIQLNDTIIEEESNVKEGGEEKDKPKDKAAGDADADADANANDKAEAKPPTKGNEDDSKKEKKTTIKKGSNFIVIEKRDMTKKEVFWPRAAGDDWKENLKSGDIIDTKDDQDKWYEALVRYVYPKDCDEKYKDKIVVHYIGWNIKWDERLVKHNTKRVGKRHHETTGPHRPRKKEYGGGYYDNSFSFWQNENGPPEQRGVIGLRNLGNTCFMNSTIQCLAQSPSLTDYFLNNDYLHHVNKKNPLGWGGRVAKAWALLLHDMFSGKYRTVAPRQFKNAIGEVAPRFMGYAQQDSQELLSFLLDGLHEDLNQIENKPTTEAVDNEGRSDEAVAADAWKTYLRRNQSTIVDLLQGQYKSKVVCPDCGRVSITFDPYMFLSAPLPTEKYKMIEYTWVDGDTSIPPTVYGQKMLKVADIGMLKESVAKAHGVDKDELFICDIWKSKIHRELKRNDAVADINRKSDDIFIYHSARPDMTKYKSKDADKNENDNGDKENDKAAGDDDGAGAGAGGAGGNNGNAGGDEEQGGAGNGGNNGNKNRNDRNERSGDYDDYSTGVRGAGNYGSYNSNRGGKNKKKNPYQTFVVNNSKRVQVRNNYSSQTRYEDEPFGFPLLITLPTTCEVTKNQIRDKLWVLAQSFLVEPLQKEDDLPFRFWASWGFNNNEEIKENDDIFDLRLRNLKFMIHWEDSSKYNAKKYDTSDRQRHETAPPPVDPNSTSSVDDNRRGRGKPVDLEACLEAFCEEETLSENDAWYCSKCKDFKCATKKIDLWNTPDLLIVHLKRFSYTRNWRDRINTVVKFPLENLDLAPYLLDPDCKKDALYDLYAVSNHMGGMGGGHYTAYAKNLENHKWYHLDDSRTSRVSNPDNIVSSAAYVLYYTRKVRRGVKHRASRVILPGIDDATTSGN